METLAKLTLLAVIAAAIGLIGGKTAQWVANSHCVPEKGLVKGHYLHSCSPQDFEGETL